MRIIINDKTRPLLKKQITDELNEAMEFKNFFGAVAEMGVITWIKLKIKLFKEKEA